MQKTERTERQDVYTRITAQIVADLEKGVRPWVKPWNAEHAAGRITRPLRRNGQPYSGINILSLWMSATAQNFAAPIWMTFRQAVELDAHVRKGEKGSLVVYANSITRTEHDDKTGEDVEREIPHMKGYTAFNVEQIDGLPEIYYAKAAPTLDPVARIDHAEKFLQATGAVINHGGNRANYSLSTDTVQMPPFESFRDADSYYSTLAHELTHWTSAKNRLDRDLGGHRFGSNAHAQEKLLGDLELALELAKTTRRIFATGWKSCRTTAAQFSPPPRTRKMPLISSTNSAPAPPRKSRSLVRLKIPCPSGPADPTPAPGTRNVFNPIRQDFSAAFLCRVRVPSALQLPSQHRSQSYSRPRGTCS